MTYQFNLNKNQKFASGFFIHKYLEKAKAEQYK